MTEPQGQVAGRLSVIVEASLAGFRRELKNKVEAASKGIQAEVGVKLDAKKLRKELQAKVDEASRDVKATVGIDLDAKSLKAKVEAAAKEATAKATVNVDADTGTVVADTVAAADAAEAAAGTIRVPMKVRARSFIAEVLAKRAEAQAAASAGGGVRVPVTADPQGFGFGGRGLRGKLRFGLIAGLVSLVQPAVGAIGQLVAGLTAMASAGAPAVATLSAIPIGIAAMLQSMAGGKIALQGFGQALQLLGQQQAALARGDKLTEVQQKKLKQALKELSPSAREVAKDVVGLRGAWVKMRKGIQEKFFSRIADDVKPLAEKLLPLLEKRLGGTAARLGDAAHATAVFLQTKGAQSDVGKVMKNNNIIMSDFLYMVGQFGKGSLDLLVASRRFGRGFGQTMRDVGDWFAGKAARGRRTGDFADFLDRASRKATQLWHITQQIGHGFGGIFHAAVPSGNRLLHTFDNFVTHWATWTNSVKGQDYLRDWFDGAEGGFIEFSRLINSTFKGMAKWAADPKIAGMLRTIRKDLGPALGDLLQKLGDDMGTTVIDLLTQLVRLLEHAEPAVKVTTQFAKALNQLVAAINDLADANPHAADTVATVIGGLMVVGAVGRITKLGRALLGLKSAAKGVGAAGAEVEAGAVGLSKLGKLGALGGLIGKFSKFPLLKKAGVVGAVLTSIDLSKQVVDAFTFDGRQRKVIEDGIRNGNAMKAIDKAWADAFNDKNHSWHNPDLYGDDVAKFIKDFGIDSDRLKREIAKYGTTGRYYKQTIDHLRNDFSGHGALDGLGILPGVNFDSEKARTLANSIEGLAKDAQAAMIKAAKHANVKADLASLLFGPMLDGSKMGKQIADMADQAVSELKKAAGRVQDALKDFLNPKVKPHHGPPMRPDTFDAADAFGPHKAPKNPFALPVGGSPRHAPAAAPVGPTIKAQAKVRSAVQATVRKVAELGTGFFNLGKKADSSGKRGARALEHVATSAKKAATSTKKSATDQGKAFDQIPKKAHDAVTNTVKMVERMGRQVAHTASGLKRDVGKGMDGVVGAVRSHVGPAKSAATRVATGVKSPLSGLQGPLKTAGDNAMEGFARGITERGAAAVAAARSIANQVAGAVAGALQIFSPSRVMKKLGHWVSVGFAKGIMGGVGAVEKAQEHLWKRLTDKGLSAKRIHELKRRFSDEFRAIEQAAERRDRLKDRLERATNRVQQLVSDRASLKENLRSSAEEYGSVASISQANGGFATPGFLLDELKKRAKDARKFRRIINRLRKRGLGKKAIQQIIALGMEDGLPLAQQLVSGTPEELKKINKLQGIISKQAKKLGIETSKAFYDSGIEAGRALIHELKHKQKQLNKVAEHMANALVKQLRKALGLKTHKKKGDGEDGGKKGPKGGGGSGSRLLAETSRRSGGRPRGGTPGSSPRPGARGDAAAYATGPAPLVGEINLNGIPDRETAHEVLDEAWFMLNRIKLGGVYADRTG